MSARRGGGGRIITFYSYKGGTGRSMALANVAWVLASNRKRVLVIDWDLEAPGLHRYFRPFLIDEYLSSSDGLIDFVMAYADEVIKPPAGPLSEDWFAPYTNIRRYALSVNYRGFPPPGKIDLVPAGRQGPAYATRVSSFDWHNFYDRLGGGAFIEAVRARVRGEYDYVLVDSRTGVSDTAGICTVQMPDALAVCFTYNNQSIEGAAAIARSAREGHRAFREADGAGGFDVTPIPTRVELTETGKLRARRRYARSHFDALLDSSIDRDAYWQSVEVPYVPFYGFEETLAPFSDEPNDPKSLLSAIVRITQRLTAKDAPDEPPMEFSLPLTEEEKLRVRQQFAATPGADEEEAAAPATAESALQERVRQADNAFQLLPAQLQAAARRILTRLVRAARPEDGGHVRQRVRVRDLGQPADAVAALAGARVISVERDPSGGDETAEIADESLIQHWPRLRNWIDQDFDFLVWRQKLREQLKDWEGSDFKSDFLLRGLPLRTAQQWLSVRMDDLNDAERRFIDGAIRMEREAAPETSRGIGSRRAFIVRPFGRKRDLQGNEIDFDEVERSLIAPALKVLGLDGGTTIDIVESGNIRISMFQRLLTSDLIIADLSVHNANVFYELGIRHALRERGTFFLRCDGDAFPFELQAERYFVYRKDDPAASLSALVEALRRTNNAGAKDSPVFMSLPDLREPDPSLFTPVPQDFGEEVARVAAEKRTGDLALLSHEIKGFDWELRGLRAVGTAQYDLKAMTGARVTWENVLKIAPNDLEANFRLGTIYERLGDLAGSTQALERALRNTSVKQSERAEAYSLLGRNAKTRWRQEWEVLPPGERATVALRSPHLLDSFENYERAFNEDLNHFYSGLNALAMLKVLLGLADALPYVWGERFRNQGKAADALEEHREQAEKLAAAVEMSLSAAVEQLRREGRKDVWVEISAADLNFLTLAGQPSYVASCYRNALTSAPDFAADSVRKQLAIYRDLGVLVDNLAEVFNVVGEPPPLQPAPSTTEAQPLPRVLLFAGHMIDEPGRERPRFPADAELLARARIKEALISEMHSGKGVASAYAGGASGGDILFQEVCDELSIPARLYLAVPPNTYVAASVQKAGPQWVERFWRLYNARSEQGQVRVLSAAPGEGRVSDGLPPWLRERPGYNIWERNNLWMLFNALDEACVPKSPDPNVALIALWDGEPGDGTGGTSDLVHRVEQLGGRTVVIPTKPLFGISP